MPSPQTYLATNSEFGPGNSSGIEILLAETEISSAEILAMNSTPVQIIPAPGAGKAISILSVIINYQYGTSDYATNTTLTGFFDTIGDATTNPYCTNQSLLPSTSSKIGTFRQNSPADIGVGNNKPFMLATKTGNPTGGDGTLKVYVTYNIIEL